MEDRNEKICAELKALQNGVHDEHYSVDLRVISARPGERFIHIDRGNLGTVIIHLPTKIESNDEVKYLFGWATPLEIFHQQLDLIRTLDLNEKKVTFVTSRLRGKLELVSRQEAHEAYRKELSYVERDWKERSQPRQRESVLS